jgi:hypothetical protein
MKIQRLLGVAAVVLALLTGAARTSSANLLPGQVPNFQITVSSDAPGELPLTLTPTLSPTPGGEFTGTGTGSRTSFSFSSSFLLSVDPSINGSFMLTNLSGITQTFTLSATLGTNPLSAPTKMGGSFGDATYTDASGDSLVEVATVGNDPFYSALIDGVVVASRGSFDDPFFGGPGITGTHSQEAFGTPIPSQIGPGVASSIGVSFKFSITPGDTVSTPFEFVVVSAPEPEFLPVFAMGIALFLCISARKSASRGK